MNNLDVKNTIEKIFDNDNDFDFVYISGDGDYADTFAIKFLGDSYVKDYKCQINITLNFNSGTWCVDVNGFNALEWVDDDTELAFAIKQQQKFTRVPCSDQLIAESVDQPDEFYC